MRACLGGARDPSLDRTVDVRAGTMVGQAEGGKVEVRERSLNRARTLLLHAGGRRLTHLMRSS